MASEASGSTQVDNADPATVRSKSRSGSDSSRRRRRSRKAGAGLMRWGTFAGVLALAVAVAMAPLAAGAVHRSTAMGVFALTLLALGLVVSTELTVGVPIRMSFPAATVLLVFVLLPFVQCIPLPSGLANHLDPVAADLMAGATA